jgi:hypothetical protein
MAIAPTHRKVVVRMLGVSTLLIWFGFLTLFEYYSSTRPSRPDADSGRVYQVNNHGSYAYLTRGEQWSLWCLEFGTPPFFLAAATLAQRWRGRIT